MPPSPHGFFVASPHAHFIESPHGMRGGVPTGPGEARVNVTARDSSGNYYLAIVDHDTFTLNTTDTGPNFTPTADHHIWSFGKGLEPSPGSGTETGSRYFTWGLTNPITGSSEWIARNGTTNIREYTASLSPNGSGFVVLSANDSDGANAYMWYWQGVTNELRRADVVGPGSASFRDGYDIGSSLDNLAIEIDSSNLEVYVYADISGAILKLDGADGVAWSVTLPGTGSKTFSAMEKNPQNGIWYLGYNYVTEQKDQVLKVPTSDGVATIAVTYSEPEDTTMNREKIRSITRVKDSLYVLVSQQVEGADTGGTADNVFDLYLDRYDHASPGSRERLVLEEGHGPGSDPFESTVIAEGHSLE